jgi:hypothetical protein
MVADESSEPPQPKVLHPIVYGCVRLAALYVFTSVTSLAVFKTFHSWPSNDEMFFFTWPRVWFALILHPFFWNGACLLVVLFAMQLPVAWGLRSGNKWYRNAAILIAFYVQSFIATLLLGTGV